MLVIERFYNPVILASLSPNQTPVTVGGISERWATCRGEKAATSLKKKAEFLQSLLECRFATASSSGASFFAWQRRARNEWLVMNRKGPWEGYRRQAPLFSPVVSFPPSFARTFSSKERRLGTRQISRGNQWWRLEMSARFSQTWLQQELESFAINWKRHFH